MQNSFEDDSRNTVHPYRWILLPIGPSATYPYVVRLRNTGSNPFVFLHLDPSRKSGGRASSGRGRGEVPIRRGSRPRSRGKVSIRGDRRGNSNPSFRVLREDGSEDAFLLRLPSMPLPTSTFHGSPNPSQIPLRSLFTAVGNKNTAVRFDALTSGEFLPRAQHMHGDPRHARTVETASSAILPRSFVGSTDGLQLGVSLVLALW